MVTDPEKRYELELLTRQGGHSSRCSPYFGFWLLPTLRAIALTQYGLSAGSIITDFLH